MNLVKSWLPLLFILASAAAHGDSSGGKRLKADVACEKTAKPLEYDCTATLREAKTLRPIDGAKLTVAASMPSMPMAHRVPVQPTHPSGKSGQYRFRLPLEMHGQWALSLRLESPWRDTVVQRVTF